MGPQRVSALRWKHPVSEAFLKSFVNAGVPLNPDLNGASHEGVAWNQGSTIEGKRHSAWEAFIRPKLGNPALTFIDDTMVETIMFEGRRAVGIRAIKGGSRVTFKARKGVVLSAGSINSPQILMLSGIGEPQQLKRHGIEPVIESPDVGRNLMEHPGLYVLAEMNVQTANSLLTPISGVKTLAEWFLRRRGFMSVPTAQVLAFLKSEPGMPDPDLQFHLFPFGWVKKNGRITVPNRKLTTMLVNINYPKSTGHLELRSNDPFAPVAIYPRLLDHPDDFNGVKRGLGWIRKLASTPPFGSQVVNLIDVPAPSAGADADEAYIRKSTVPFLHPVGTCRMGTDDRAVLTPDLKVRGADNLWVADASIFPRHIAGNTNATSIMIGERASDLVEP
jgi:choline dehydrogenase